MRDQKVRKCLWRRQRDALARSLPRDCWRSDRVGCHGQRASLPNAACSCFRSPPAPLPKACTHGPDLLATQTCLRHATLAPAAHHVTKGAGRSVASPSFPSAPTCLCPANVDPPLVPTHCVQRLQAPLLGLRSRLVPRANGRVAASCACSSAGECASIVPESAQRSIFVQARPECAHPGSSSSFSFPSSSTPPRNLHTK